MHNVLKTIVGGIMMTGFVAIASFIGIKASDDTLIADLNGDGTEEIVTYYQDINPLDNGDIDYSFKMTVNGKKAYEEGGLIERYPEATEENRLHDKLDHLKNINVTVVDVNPEDNTKEIVASYYADVDNILLSMKVFKYNNGKLKAVSEYNPEGAHAYVPTEQNSNKYIKVNVETYTPVFGNIWLTKNYKLTKKGFVEKTNKNGVYTIAPARYEENKLAKYTAAWTFEVFANKNCMVDDSIGMVGEGETYVVKKVIFLEDNEFGPMKAYIKAASGLKGWIFIDNETDETGKLYNEYAVK